MPTTAVPGGLEIGAVSVGYHLADQLFGDKNIKTHRRLGLADMLRPSRG